MEGKGEGLTWVWHCQGGNYADGGLSDLCRFDHDILFCINWHSQTNKSISQ